MARRAENYKHEDEALLRPDAGTQAQFTKKKAPKAYRYDSSLSPALDWDGHGAARRRFTIAHELGHWICQYRAGTLKLFYCRPGDVAAAADRAAEREANVFAAELLMPEPAVRAAWAEEPKIAACAERCSVSSEAMHWRLYNLGLVEERPA